jgi:hypothetical protein
VCGSGKWLSLNPQLVESISRLGKLGKTEPGKLTET